MDPISVPDPGPSLPTRFARLFSSPKRAFDPPRTASLWWIPFLIMAAVHLGDSFALGDLYRDAQMDAIDASMADTGEMSEEQRDEMMRMMESMTSPGVVGATRVVSLALLGFLLPAALLAFGANFVLGGRTSFGQVLGVVGLTSLVGLPRDLLLLPLRAVSGNVHVYAGPASLVSPESAGLFTAMQFFDLFELYRLVPMTAGLAVVAGIPVARAAILTCGLHFTFMAVSLGMVAIGEAFK